MKSYYQRHKKAKKAASKKYRKEHKQYYKNYNFTYYRNHPFTVINKHQRLVLILRKEKVLKSDLLWSLNFYTELIKDNECHYCGSVLAPTGHGLDRMNNDLKHTGHNVVPCCRNCNYIKNHNMAYGEMMLLSPTLRIIEKQRKEVKE